jgi:hypothetical protein
MKNAMLRPILENLLNQGYSEQEIIDTLRSVSASMALKEWKKISQEKS